MPSKFMVAYRDTDPKTQEQIPGKVLGKGYPSRSVANRMRKKLCERDGVNMHNHTVCVGIFTTTGKPVD